MCWCNSWVYSLGLSAKKVWVKHSAYTCYAATHEPPPGTIPTTPTSGPTRPPLPPGPPLRRVFLPVMVYYAAQMEGQHVSLSALDRRCADLFFYW